MYKREKRKYGIFYTAGKKLKIYLAYKTLPILMLFCIFSLLLTITLTKNANSILNSKRNIRTKTLKINPLRIKTGIVYNASVGLIYYYSGNYADAIKYFKKLTLELPKNSYFQYMLAVSYFKNKKFIQSLKHINLALSFMPKNIKGKLSKIQIKYLILRAKITANNGDIGQSISILNHILKTNPYNIKTLLFLATLYIYKQDLKTAALYLNITKMSHPKNIDAYYQLSKIYFAEKNIKKGEQNLLTLINIDPYFKKAYFRLAAAYILAGKEKKAIKVFDKYLKINPYSKTALYQSAILEYALKDYKSARKSFLNLINITKKSKNNLRLINNAYFFTGISYILQKKYKKGIAYLNNLKPGRHYIDAKLQEIEIYITDYKKTRNIGYKERIVKIISKMLANPNVKKNLRFYYFSAIALAEIKNYNISAYIIKKGLLKFPNNTTLLYELGSAEHALKKDAKALEIMKKILKINPYDADALNYIGYYLAVKNKDLKKAEMYILKALSYDKGSPYILDSLGFVYYREKDYKKALKFCKIALKKLGKSATVLKHAGMDYFMLKKYEKALKYFEDSYKIKKSKKVEDYIIKTKKYIILQNSN